MKRNYIIGFALAAAVLGLIAFVAWNLFETYPRTREVQPSREARTNEYLAFDRWLEGMGHPVRVESSGSLATVSGAQERRIFIQASLFHWTDEAVAHFVRWVEDGGHLFVALDVEYYKDWDFWDNEEIILLLKEFGIEAKAEADLLEHKYDPQSPSFSREISFDTEADDALALKDWTGLNRLVQVKRGRGTLTVSGEPWFLLSSSLGDEPNARLAHALFASGEPFHDETGSWLFIRGATRVHGLFGSLFRQGNLAVLGVSVLVLIAIGFWAVIPVFGLVRDGEERPGKLLRERFLAEGHFLKRHGALHFYQDSYLQEIKRTVARKEGIGDDEAILDRVLDILGKSWQDRLICAKAFRGEHIASQDFPKMISIFNTILERL